VINLSNSGAQSVPLTAAWVHLPGVLDKEIGINLVNVEATFLSQGRGTVNSKDRNLWQGGVVKVIGGDKTVINLS